MSHNSADAIKTLCSISVKVKEKFEQIKATITNNDRAQIITLSYVTTALSALMSAVDNRIKLLCNIPETVDLQTMLVQKNLYCLKDNSYCQRWKAM